MISAFEGILYSEMPKSRCLAHCAPNSWEKLLLTNLKIVCVQHMIRVFAGKLYHKKYLGTYLIQ